MLQADLGSCAGCKDNFFTYIYIHFHENTISQWSNGQYSTIPCSPHAISHITVEKMHPEKTDKKAEKLRLLGIIPSCKTSAFRSDPLSRDNRQKGHDFCRYDFEVSAFSGQDLAERIAFQQKCSCVTDLLSAGLPCGTDLLSKDLVELIAFQQKWARGSKLLSA